MADDLDDALFNLAAGRKTALKKRSRKASESDDEPSADSADSEEEAPRRKKAATSKRGKKVQSEEDDEDDDSDFDDEEGLYENEEDRRKLMAMTELEREMILADRAEQRDKERQRRQLLQQRAVTDKVEAKGRRKGADKGKGKAEEAKAPQRGRAARTAAAARTARDWSDEESDGGGKSSEEEEEEFQPSGSSGASSDEEDAQAGKKDEEEEEEEAEREQAPPPRGRSERVAAVAAPPVDDDEARRHAAAKAKEAERERMRERERERVHSDDEAAEEASMEELLACQVTRQQLEEWYMQPFFERDALNGCVVRMAYGPGVRDHAGNTHPGYLVMEIMDIKESGRAYKFGPKSEMTNKHLVLRDGMGINRTMAMANVSSKPFDEQEYERYKRHCSKTNRAPITREEAAEATKRKQAAMNYRWTSADLKVELERKRAQRAAPVNPAAEKAMLKRRLELAQGQGNADEVAALEEQLASLEAHLINQTNNQRAFGMMDINKRNKQHNLAVAYKTTAADEHGGGAGEGGTDVFSRRETKLNIYWKTNRGGGADDSNSAGAAAAARAQAALPDKLTRAQQRMDPADLIRQLGLDVDVSLVRAAGPAAGNLQQRILPHKWRGAALAAHATDLSGKSVLTIADWKRRAGDY
ncbi:hypothetical protein CHLRE_03g196450v5 [Chlamydomonas reinhardtii]|uniref:Plus3 domain-containing protein n=1 Tax=Chlamydomonas reinhardtii TaxID=3055 RepID=A0A2K3DYN4_CHLRE|nr:uncharacterized protein CHLRE_03g196450v5 [Chlamydomonas reinhardtii]PNW85650.1 hypothetical protein CHLRE_03g196450v5 [Chlamydomonas reinhardtii]